MDTTLIVMIAIFALIILAVLFVFRQRISIRLKGPGVGLDVDAENAKPEKAKPEAAAQQPAQGGVQIERVKSTEGGILATASDGGGVGIRDAEVKGDILAEASKPKDDPKA